MRVTLDVRGLADVKRELARLSGTEKDYALAAAINKTADKGRAELTRAITERYAIRADEVRNSVEIRKAWRNARDIQAVIDIFGSAKQRGRSLNMIHFLSVLAQGVKTRGSRAKKADVKGLSRQLGFTILKSGGVKRIDGAFVGNKGRTIFRRTGKGRLPIEPVQVIGVGQMFRHKPLNERVMARIEEEFGVELSRAVEMVLARR
jgi:hypothetical protein